MDTDIVLARVCRPVPSMFTMNEMSILTIIYRVAKTLKVMYWTCTFVYEINTGYKILILLFGNSYQIFAYGVDKTVKMYWTCTFVYEINTGYKILILLFGNSYQIFAYGVDKTVKMYWTCFFVF